MLETDPHKLGNSITAIKHVKTPVVGWHYLGKKRTYGIQTVWQSLKGENTMYHEISLHCTKMDGPDAVWEISKSNYFLNNSKAEAPMEQLALACAAPMYPFEFTADFDGHMTRLLNTEKIRAQFATARDTLERDFGGEVVMAYIAEVGASLNNPQRLKKMVTADVWLSLFFTPINGTYDTDRARPISIDFPFFGFQDPLKFDGKAALGKPNSDQMTQEINVETELDPSTGSDRPDILTGGLTASYDIEIPGHFIKNIDARATVKTHDGEYKVFVQGYLIREEDIALSGGNKEKTSKGSWWSIFDS